MIKRWRDGGLTGFRGGVGESSIKNTTRKRQCKPEIFLHF